jgi:hypothetical protein
LGPVFCALAGRAASAKFPFSQGQGERYVVPGHIYQLTHRCHDRQFLLRFAKDRNGYAELNMVRRGVVAPGNGSGRPTANRWGWRKRNRLWDLEKLLSLLRCSQLDEFRAQFNAALSQALVNWELERQAKWTEAIAVGLRICPSA